MENAKEILLNPAVWDVFNDNDYGMDEEQYEEFKREQQLNEDAAVVFGRVLNTDDGRFVVDYLVNRFLIGSSFRPDYPLNECVKWGLIREGQMMAVNHILTMAKFSKTVDFIHKRKDKTDE